MYRAGLFAAVLALVVAVSLSSCTKPAEISQDPAPDVMPVEDVPEAAGTTEEPAAPADELNADTIVEEVGAPVFEGATATSAQLEEGASVALFATPATYQDVKGFYMGALKAPDWTNNGFEMGAMGGDEWEFKSADETKLVMVKRDSGASETVIKFTIKPAS